MALDPTLQAEWTRFLRETGRDRSTPCYDSFHFDDNEPSSRALARLVLSGAKRATASLLRRYEALKRRPPQAGDLSVVTDWDGVPLCVIETTDVDICAFEDVDEAFAAEEGEGDRSLEHWRRVHWSFFGRECERLGCRRSRRMPVVCQRFEVVYVVDRSRPAKAGRPA